MTQWYLVQQLICTLISDWEGKGPCTIVPLTWKMAHQSLCRMIRNGPLKISKSLKKAENGPLAKISSQSLNHIIIIIHHSYTSKMQKKVTASTIWLICPFETFNFREILPKRNYPYLQFSTSYHANEFYTKYR